MSRSPNHNTVDAAAFQAEFEALDIPANIDPRLLALWIEREQNELALAQQKKAPPPPQHTGRSLIRLFPAYIGISVMCLALLLGLIQRQDPLLLLKTTCIAFLVYTMIGMFVGMIAERCVNDSVETLLRDMAKRNRESESQQ